MDRIEAAKQRAQNGMEMFLRNFSKVPDDRLHWQATPTAKSALRIAAHTALYAKRFAQMIRERQVPQPENLDTWLAARDAEECAVTTRDSIERIFREGTEELLDAMSTLTEAELDASVDSGQGWSMPMAQVIDLPALHAALHTGQIDFLQTCWGDQEVYTE
jgi:uncharacterized damage-inducible protein DinB